MNIESIIKNKVYQTINSDNIDNIDENVERIEKFLNENNYMPKYKKKYIEVVKVLIEENFNCDFISSDKIKKLAKKYNEDNNKGLIIDTTPSLWSIKGLINIFKGNKSTFDTVAFDEKEIELIAEFTTINKEIMKYVNNIKELKPVLTSEKYNSIKNKVIKDEDIGSEINGILVLIKEFKEHIVDTVAPNINVFLDCETTLKGDILALELNNKELNSEKETITIEVIDKIAVNTEEQAEKEERKENVKDNSNLEEVKEEVINSSDIC